MLILQCVSLHLEPLSEIMPSDGAHSPFFKRKRYTFFKKLSFLALTGACFIIKLLVLRTFNLML